MHDGQNVIEVEHIGLQCLVDLDRGPDRISVVCGGPDILIGKVDKSAVVQARQKAGWITPACGRACGRVEIDSVPVANRSTDKKVNGAFDKADIGVLLWRTAGQRTAADWRKWHNEPALPNPLASWNLLASM